MSSSAKPHPMAQHFVECEHCETRPAQHFCNTCPGALCEICKEKHKRKKISRDHEIIPLVSSKKQASPFCFDHRTERCKFYCKPCKKPVCSKCFTEKHKGHTIEKLASILEEQRDKLLQCINKIGKFLIPAHENLLTEAKNNYAGVIKSTDETGTSVREHTENIIRAIKSAESEILSALEKSGSQTLSSIQSEQSVVNERINRLHEIKKTLQEMYDSNAVDDTLLKQQMTKMEAMTILPKMTTVTPSKFVPESVEASIIKKHIGNLTLFKTQISRTLEVSVPRTIVRSDKKLTKPVWKAELMVCVKNQYAVQYMDTDTAVVSGNDNKIRVVDICGKVRKINTNLHEGQFPNGFCLTKENDIIYSDKLNRKIMRISVTGDISTLLTLRNEYFPIGLSVTHSGNILICLVVKCDFSDVGQRGKVVEYTTSGQIIKEFINDGGKELFKRPAYVANNPLNDDILVSDQCAEKVIALNGMGNLKFAYDGEGLSKPGKFDPIQITCDSMCHILIADYFSNGVHVISQDGDPLTLLLAGELDRPMGVCFDGVDSIWITEWKSQKIKIYKYLEQT